jgi:ABC-type glucose/galactose transport system permease subunit
MVTLAHVSGRNWGLAKLVSINNLKEGENGTTLSPKAIESEPAVLTTFYCKIGSNDGSRVSTQSSIMSHFPFYKQISNTFIKLGFFAFEYSAPSLTDFAIFIRYFRACFSGSIKYGHLKPF